MGACAEPRWRLREARGSLGRPAARDLRPGRQGWKAGLRLGEIHPRRQPARLGEEGADGGPGGSGGSPARCLAQPQGPRFSFEFRVRIPPALVCAQRVLWTPSGCSLHTLGRAERASAASPWCASCAGNLGRRQSDEEGFARQPFPNPLPSAPASLPGRACPSDPVSWIKKPWKKVRLSSASRVES